MLAIAQVYRSHHTMTISLMPRPGVPSRHGPGEPLAPLHRRCHPARRVGSRRRGRAAQAASGRARGARRRGDAPRAGSHGTARRARASADRRALAADVRHLDPGQVDGRALRAQLRVAVGAHAPEPAQPLVELGVRDRSSRTQRAQVVAAAREQAGVELALGRQPGARAVVAERLGDRRDQADLALAVAVAVARGDLAAVGRIDRARAASARRSRSRSRPRARPRRAASRWSRRRPCTR